jgi:hypothetical protein
MFPLCGEHQAAWMLGDTRGQGKPDYLVCGEQVCWCMCNSMQEDLDWLLTPQVEEALVDIIFVDDTLRNQCLVSTFH